ncbi:MAG: hypothetical protein ACOC3E_02330 [Cyanobacteriota bacterium]
MTAVATLTLTDSASEPEGESAAFRSLSNLTTSCQLLQCDWRTDLLAYNRWTEKGFLFSSRLISRKGNGFTPSSVLAIAIFLGSLS